MKFCPKCGNPEIDDSITECSACGASFSAPTSSQNNPDQTPDRPMKWYKFLIYFLLFASALINLSSTVSLVRSMTLLFKYSETVTLGIYCAVLACLSLIVAILAIVTRQKLANYKKDGPTYLMTLYGLNAAGVLLGFVFGLTPIESTVTTVVVSLAMIFINKTYFDNRRHMFNK